MGDVVCQWKMGFVETLIHLKTPSPPILRPVHRALGGLSYSNIVPVNQYVYLIILCLHIHALSHNRYKIMYVCQLITSLKKGMSAILYMLIMFEKDAFYVRQSKLKKGKQ